MKLRLRLDTHPTFKKEVEFPAIGEEEGPLVINFTFRHMDRREYRRMLAEADKADDQEKEWVTTILKLAESWDVEDMPLDEESIGELLDRYHGLAGPLVLQSYSRGLIEGKQGNSRPVPASSTESESQSQS